ncbi:MBL fold metallo-hydrolase [Paenibacillus albiflavus]|uniref:MBL fold metallo-hydrolase n=1 Tax=Paenibacillus albiflavus TaxID=2545760 RepID=A0A4R4EKV2_9BACL|nr:MBL fold metallo-hydrolase [Paenibacillus albiflavus]TCZ80123.1 MBL fold metallo-hydrolase [Paenibacillus albiflavus]
MQVASGVEMLEISANIMGETTVIHPTIIWDEQHVVLVDTGYPGQLDIIRKAMAQAGIPIERLTTIILTHQDIDHIGCLPAIMNEFPHNRIEVLANEIERPYIQGDKLLIKFAHALSQIDSWPEEQRTKLKPVFENPPKGRVDRTLQDGEVLPYCGGLTVINTPGHTPGHISLYHQASQTLIAGDAMFIVDGKLALPDPKTTIDMEAAEESVKKIQEYDYKQMICYHGGLYIRS